MGINRAPLPTPQSVQAKMAFANNILVVGVVLALAVRSSWELGDKVFDVQLLGKLNYFVTA